MCAECTQGDDGLVSLFPREWIEISVNASTFTMTESPSLRGSGLKLRRDAYQCQDCKRLPLYEGVD